MFVVVSSGVSSVVVAVSSLEDLNESIFCLNLKEWFLNPNLPFTPNWTFVVAVVVVVMAAVGFIVVTVDDDITFFGPVTTVTFAVDETFGDSKTFGTLEESS